MEQRIRIKSRILMMQNENDWLRLLLAEMMVEENPRVRDLLGRGRARHMVEDAILQRESRIAYCEQMLEAIEAGERARLSTGKEAAQ